MSATGIAAFDRFVVDMRALYGEALQPEAHWKKAAGLLGVLIANEAFRRMTDDWPVGDGKQYVIYEDPDHGFVVDGLVRGPWHKAAVHDHAHTWTAYGIVSGRERMTRYVRVDDGSDPDRAEIELVSSEVCQAGTVDVIPPRELHTESNEDSCAVALSVRSENLGGFDQIVVHEDGRMTTIRGLERIEFPLQ